MTHRRNVATPMGPTRRLRRATTTGLGWWFLAGMVLFIRRPPARFRQNGFGLHDVLGNVWEWVADCGNESYVGAPSDGSAWTDGNCSKRVRRGGSWYSKPRYLRSAYRGRSTAWSRSNIYGFRVARTLTP